MPRGCKPEDGFRDRSIWEDVEMITTYRADGIEKLVKSLLPKERTSEAENTARIGDPNELDKVMRNSANFPIETTNLEKFRNLRVHDSENQKKQDAVVKRSTRRHLNTLRNEKGTGTDIFNRDRIVSSDSSSSRDFGDSSRKANPNLQKF